MNIAPSTSAMTASYIRLGLCAPRAAGDCEGFSVTERLLGSPRRMSSLLSPAMTRSNTSRLVGQNTPLLIEMCGRGRPDFCGDVRQGGPFRAGPRKVIPFLYRVTVILSCSSARFPGIHKPHPRGSFPFAPLLLLPLPSLLSRPRWSLLSQLSSLSNAPRLRRTQHPSSSPPSPAYTHPASASPRWLYFLRASPFLLRCRPSRR